MKHLISYKLYEYNSVLPKNYAGKPIYPWDKLEAKIDQFVYYFTKKMDEEGWYIGLSDEGFFADDYDTSECAGEVFVVSRKNEISFGEAERYANNYGFITDKHGVIYDFDDEKFNKYKHLITGKDLNLL